MQPLVIDMGGADIRKFASRADFEKVSSAQAIKIVNSGGYDGIYRQSTQLGNIAVPPGESGAKVFVLDSFFDDEGGFAAGTYAGVYQDGDNSFKINISEY